MVGDYFSADWVINESTNPYCFKIKHYCVSTLSGFYDHTVIIIHNSVVQMNDSRQTVIKQITRWFSS